MSASETGLGQDGGWEGGKLDQRRYLKLLHKSFCNSYGGYPCAVIATIYEEAKTAV